MGMQNMSGKKAPKPPRLIQGQKVKTSNDSAAGAGKAPSPPIGSKQSVDVPIGGKADISGGSRKKKKGGY